MALIYRMNDIILSVNGVNTVDVTHDQAVGALKRAGNTVQLVSWSALSWNIIPPKRRFLLMKITANELYNKGKVRVSMSYSGNQKTHYLLAFDKHLLLIFLSVTNHPFTNFP